MVTKSITDPKHGVKENLDHLPVAMCLFSTLLMASSRSISTNLCNKPNYRFEHTDLSIHDDNSTTKGNYIPAKSNKLVAKLTHQLRESHLMVSESTFLYQNDVDHFISSDTRATIAFKIMCKDVLFPILTSKHISKNQGP